MKLDKLASLVIQSVHRNRRDFLLSSIGIVVGISTLLFFSALGAGIKQVVLEEIFVVRQLEVVKKTFDVAGIRSEGLFGGKKLDERTVERLGNIDGVAEVYPKMKLTFPASVRGGEELMGRDMVAELIADGIPPSLVAGELDGNLAFKDWGADLTCSADADCPSGHACTEGACQANSCSTKNDPACGGQSYCHVASKQCRMPIPVIASPRMLELYNGSFQTAMGGARGMLSKLPKLSEDALVGFSFDGVFGRSFLGESARGGRVAYRMQLVGFSDKAIGLGATMPIGYVRRLNEKFGSKETSGEYHSIVVETTSNEAVPRVAQQIKDMGLALSDDYEDAQRAGLLIMLLTLVFNFISLVILGISAVNIMHTFMMVILERRRELGLMRALGATRGAIRALVVSEATVLGIFGGMVGIFFGWLAIEAADWLFATQVGDFPFKPESLFVIEPWMIGAALGVAVFFCWLGSLIPAFQASHVDPSRTLSGH